MINAFELFRFNDSLFFEPILLSAILPWASKLEKLWLMLFAQYVWYKYIYTEISLQNKECKNKLLRSFLWKVLFQQLKQKIKENLFG